MAESTPSPVLRKLGRPTADERIRRRAQILDAALGVFLEHGYGDTTLEQLATASHATKRTLYNYFGDKAGLFAAMVRRLSKTVSSSAREGEGLVELATRIVYRLNSPELVGLHRLVIAEAYRFPELAVSLHEGGAVRHIERLRERISLECGPEFADRAQELFTLLLGERHRRRMHGLGTPVTEREARIHAVTALEALDLVPRRPRAVPAD